MLTQAANAAVFTAQFPHWHGKQQILQEPVGTVQSIARTADVLPGPAANVGPGASGFCLHKYCVIQ